MFRWVLMGMLMSLAMLACPAFAQDFDRQEFEAFATDAMSASRMPGMAVMLFDENGVSYEKAFGVVDAQKTAATLDTPFQLGSVSKSFAALLLVQLAADGLVELDTPVADILPNFRTRDADSWRKITVRHVMSHRSGLATLDGNRMQDNQYRGADALDRALVHIQKAKLFAEPGAQFQYSNANYMIVAALVEKLAGKPFETVMDERVFTPLGMDNSYVQMPERSGLNEASGFRQWFGVPRVHRFVPGRAMMGAGGVTASARDLALYVKAVAEKDPRIVPPEYADEIVTPQGSDRAAKFGYGFGWMLAEVDGKKVVYHSGLNGGFAANAAFYPDENRGGAVVTNLSGSLQADVAGAVLIKGMGASQEPPIPSTAQHATIWGLLATAVSLLLGFIVSTRRFSTHLKKAGRVGWIRGVLPCVILFGLAFALVKTIPQMNGITLSGLKVFYPDMWLCFAASALIATIWGLTRLGLFLRAPHAGQGE